MQRESYVKREGKKLLAAQGWLLRDLAWRGRNDAPDTYAVKNGVTVLIEWKRPSKDARVSQAREHQHLRWSGATVQVFDTVEKVEAFLETA